MALTMTPASALQRTRSFVAHQGLLVAFLLLALGLTLLSDRFLTFDNLTNVLRQSSINGIIAVGMTVVILTAGIDLSVGAVLALTAVVTADLLQSGTPVPVAMLAGLGLGCALGAVSGLVITRFRVPPFVATLGMMTIARGLALVYTDGRPITGLPDSFRSIGTGSLGPIPAPILVAGAVFAVFWFALHRTVFGRYVYAIGTNQTAATFAGLRVNGALVTIYALAGACASLAGFILIARLDSAQPTAGFQFEFDAIAAVVVGGTALAGGVGKLSGTFLGVLIIAVINNGLNLLDVSSFYQPIVTGSVIALALLLQRNRSG